MFKHFKQTTLVLGVVAAAGIGAQQAHAAGPYSCTNATYGSTYSSCSANNTANQASTVATSSAVTRAAVGQASSLVSDRVSAALNGGSAFSIAQNGFSASTGMAAGNHSAKVGAWLSGAWSDVEDDNADTRFDGDVYSGMVGIDYRVTPRTVLGIAVGYENTDLDTGYNGFGAQKGSLEADGYTIAPYIGVQLSDKASANLTVGYSDLEYDTVRFDPNTGNRITGSTDAERYFVDASVVGSHMLRNNWHLRGKAGIFYASEDKDGFTERESNGATISNASRDNDFGQISLDGKLGYVYQQVEPYALVGLQFDYAKDEAPVAAGQNRSSLDDEDFGAKFGAGLDFQLAPNVTGGIEGYTVEFRDDYSEYTVTGGLRVKF